ncbi:hypothetical protein JCM1841_006245 [Sporobolomyces salmonicolor]
MSITIRNLPAEIISQIVSEVRHIYPKWGLPAPGSDTHVHIDPEEPIYPDGLPSNPLLPLLFVSRPFFHAARKVLYDHVSVSTAHDAWLLLESFSAGEHAARTADEDAPPAIEHKEGDGHRVQKNVLASFVRQLSLGLIEYITAPRGVAQIYIKLIEKTSRNLEKLAIQTMFPKSVTKPLLDALSHLPRLQSLAIRFSTDRESPSFFTPPHLLAIQRTSPDLDELTVEALAGAEDRPTTEAYTMVGTKRGNGLKTLVLVEPDVTLADFKVILRDSQQTLTRLHMCRPSSVFTRFDLAFILLTYGETLTDLRLRFESSWWVEDPPFPEGAVPACPSDYQTGKPTTEHLQQIADASYILDAALMYLPRLVSLDFNGALATAEMLNYVPESLQTLTWGNCPTIEPGMVIHLLSETVTHQKWVTQADGTKGIEEYTTYVAPGLTSMSVVVHSYDYWTWNNTDQDGFKCAAEHHNIRCTFAKNELCLTPTPWQYL